VCAHNIHIRWFLFGHMLGWCLSSDMSASSNETYPFSSLVE
jgi:hypothetical protein